MKYKTCSAIFAASAVIVVGAAAIGFAQPSLEVTLSARAYQPGELVVVHVDAPPATESVRVRAFDRNIPAFRDQGWRALVGIDLNAKPGTYRVSVEAGGQAAERTFTVVPKSFRTRKLTVDPDFVTPPPSAAERIAADARLLEATWRAADATPHWSAAFIAPVTEPANSAFGSRSVFNGKALNPHGGADFASAAGTEVHAPNAGRVAVARNLYYSGNTVVIDHGGGLFSLLAHLSAIDVAEGASIDRNRLVGRVGATGRVTGPHLHWAVRVNDARVDPISLLALLGDRGQP